MANGKLMESWTFQRTLPEPFKDYTDNAVFKNIASKYCTQPQKRSTLHAATLQAVLTYMELEEPAGGKSAEELGAIGSRPIPIRWQNIPAAPENFMWWSITLQTGNLSPGSIRCHRIRKTHRKNMYSKIPRIQELLCYSL